MTFHWRGEQDLLQKDAPLMPDSSDRGPLVEMLNCGSAAWTPGFPDKQTQCSFSAKTTTLPNADAWGSNEGDRAGVVAGDMAVGQMINGTLFRGSSEVR